MELDTDTCAYVLVKGPYAGHRCALKLGHGGHHRPAEMAEAQSEQRREYSRGWMRGYARNNREEYRAYHQQWVTENREHMALYKREWKFRLTPDQQTQLLALQGGRCGVCQVDLDSLPSKVVTLDHDHACCPPTSTGQDRTCGECVRGFVCGRCNHCIAAYEKGRIGARTAEKIDVIRAYLADPPAQRLRGSRL